MKNSGFSLGIFSYMQHPLSSRKRHHDRRSSRPKSPVREACRRRKTRSHDTLRGRRSTRSPTLHRITRASGAPARKAPAAGVEEADGGRGAHVEAFARGLDRNVEATVGSLKARIGDAWSLGAHQPANGAPRQRRPPRGRDPRRRGRRPRRCGRDRPCGRPRA